MINFDYYSNESKTKHNQNWPYNLDHPYRILITGGSGSGTRNALLNLIENKPHIDQIYLYAKDLYEAKYQYLIDIRQKEVLDYYMMQKLLLSIQMNCKMFIKILMNTM